MSAGTDRDRLARLDEVTADLRDRADEWVRQVRAVEREVYARPGRSDGEQQQT